VGTALLTGCLPIPVLPKASPSAAVSPGASASASPKAAGVISVPEEGKTHVARPTRVNYRHQPPSSGNHYSDRNAPVPYDVYDEVLPEEWVHNLEHGAIVMVYRCDGTTECDTMFGQATQVFDQLPDDPTFGKVKFVSTPYLDMDPKVAVLAWTKELDLDSIDVASITTFYNRYVDKGPELLP
jgi:hypothetical protein